MKIFKIIKIFYNGFMLWLNYNIKLEQSILSLRCLINDKNELLSKIIKNYPIKRQKLVIRKVYRMTYDGYSLDSIINELKFYRNLINEN